MYEWDKGRYKNSIHQETVSLSFDFGLTKVAAGRRTHIRGHCCSSNKDFKFRKWKSLQIAGIYYGELEPTVKSFAIRFIVSFQV